ncbi:MAG: hypothetical protein K2Q01_00835 [Rickettsiales bacterium]|nr:hypothetical protein [Rickettsiales bacterium]
MMLSLSIAFAGFPAQAKPECPMAKMMQMEHPKSVNMHSMKDCKGCAKMAKHEPKKLGCCDDAACNAKCSALSGGIAMNLLTIKAGFAAIGTQILRLYPADTAIALRHLNTQERPPKSLA